jgi:hypothetical protein
VCAFERGRTQRASTGPAFAVRVLVSLRERHGGARALYPCLQGPRKPTHTENIKILCLKQSQIVPVLNDTRR